MSKKKAAFAVLTLLLAALLILIVSAAPALAPVSSAAAATPFTALKSPPPPVETSIPKQLIYDNAGLLTDDEREELTEMAAKYGGKRETDIIVYTVSDAGGKDVVKLTEDFYDEKGPGYDKPFGNAVILTMDMENREIYLAGFYKAEKYLDDKRLDKIRSKITPDLSKGQYAEAFETYIKTAYKYMGFRPGANPDNILFKLWFQLVVSLGLGGLIVGIMAYGSGGKITVNHRTYEDATSSGVVDYKDRYLRTTVTRRKIPKNNGGSGGGGGGGGVTRGGHSHSGSRGSF